MIVRRPADRRHWSGVRSPSAFSLMTAILLLGALLGVGSVTGTFSLRPIAIIALVTQLVAAYGLMTGGVRLLSVCSIFAGLWLIYFPLRLLVITFGGPSPYYQPVVNAAQ